LKNQFPKSKKPSKPEKTEKTLCNRTEKINTVNWSREARGLLQSQNPDTERRVPREAGVKRRSGPVFTADSLSSRTLGIWNRVRP